MLARELVSLTRGLPNVDITCLPATLHNRPGGIPAAVRDRIRRRRAGYEGVRRLCRLRTAGRSTSYLEREPRPDRRRPLLRVLRAAAAFEALRGGARHLLPDRLPGPPVRFDHLTGLGLDRHPELLPDYFGNYRRLVYLAQSDDPELTARAQAAAERLLGLALWPAATRPRFGDLATSIHQAIAGAA